jgi:hypothetical protein
MQEIRTIIFLEKNGGGTQEGDKQDGGKKCIFNTQDANMTPTQCYLMQHDTIMMQMFFFSNVVFWHFLCKKKPQHTPEKN